MRTTLQALIAALSALGALGSATGARALVPPNPFYSKMANIEVAVSARARPGYPNIELERSLSEWAAKYISEQLGRYEEIKVEAIPSREHIVRSGPDHLVMLFRVNLAPSGARCDSGNAVAVDLNYFVGQTYNDAGIAANEPYPVVGCGEPLVNVIAEAMRQQLDPFIRATDVSKQYADYRCSHGRPPGAPRYDWCRPTR